MFNEPQDRDKVYYEFKPTPYPEYNARRFARLLKKVKTISLLHAFSGLGQIMAGVILVYFSVLGTVHQPWLATFLSGLGSVITMLGAYLLYDQLRNQHTLDGLLRNAINRAITSQN